MKVKTRPNESVVTEDRQQRHAWKWGPIQGTGCKCCAPSSLGGHAGVHTYKNSCSMLNCMNSVHFG
jgi:hypothetical protein